MKGAYGRYLDVDLSTGEISDYPIPEEWYKKHIGGRGICARIMLEEVPAGADPLGPENILVFGTGPLQGLGVAGAGRNVVMTKSPKTGNASDSFVGGFWGHELGRSGFDGIIVRGRAAAPKLLVLKDGKAQLRSAQDEWGLSPLQIDEKMKRALGPTARVAAIGVAGEKAVRFACIINDGNRAAGRPGAGAVMGSKLLKAIVVQGEREKPVANQDEFNALRSEFARGLKNDPGLQGIIKFGTSLGVMYHQELGTLPTRNFQAGVFEHAGAISGESLHDGLVVGKDTCFGCPIACKRKVKTEFAGEQVHPDFGSPEYETLGAFGSLCLNSDLHSIAFLNQLCNQYGLDTISTGNLLAFLMEASERGLVRGDDKIGWGDARKMVDLVHRIARREGFGDLLAEGLVRVAEELGGQDFAVHVKGQEVPLHEPRGKMGFALSYATTPRGGVHTEGVHDNWLESGFLTPEIGVREASDRFSWRDKARIQRLYTDLQSFGNSLIVCSIAVKMLGPNYEIYYPRLREILKSVTGQEVSVQEMMKIGERNYTLLHIFQAREGYRLSSDDLPPRLKQPLPEGPSANRRIGNDELRSNIAEYYRLRGFDDIGPTASTLDRLDLLEWGAVLRDARSMAQQQGGDHRGK